MLLELETSSQYYSIKYAHTHTPMNVLGSTSSVWSGKAVRSEDYGGGPFCLLKRLQFAI